MDGEIQANNSSPKLVEPKVKTSAAIWLGVANASTGLLCAFAEGTALTYFYHNFLGLNEWASGLIWILFGIWNAINDPLYGFLADRTKSKLGRRRPWIRYGAPIMAVLFAITRISFPAMKGNQWFLGFQMGISLFLYDIVYTAIASAIYVMPYEMAVTDNARSPIFVWNVVFSVVSFGAPMVLNGMLTTLIETHADIFPWAMAAAGLVAGALVFVSTFFYKENGYHREEPQPKFLEGLKQCVKNKSFLIFEVLSWTVIFAQNALMLGLAYYAGMWASPDNNMYILYGALVVGALLSIVFYILMRNKLGNKVEALIMCGSFGAGCLLASFLGQYFWVLVLGFFLVGIGFSGGLYLVPLVNGDVIDKDEVDNGSRREGVYAGINSLITKPAGAIAQAIFPIFMGWAGFDATNKIKDENDNWVTNWEGQPESAKTGLFPSWFLVTGILLALSFLAMWFFPLHGKAWEDTKKELAIEHQKKEEAYEQKILAEMQANQATGEA